MSIWKRHAPSAPPYPAEPHCLEHIWLYVWNLSLYPSYKRRFHHCMVSDFWPNIPIRQCASKSSSTTLTQDNDQQSVGIKREYHVTSIVTHLTQAYIYLVCIYVSEPSDGWSNGIISQEIETTYALISRIGIGWSCLNRYCEWKCCVRTLVLL